jgi:hypothetical protein
VWFDLTPARWLQNLDFAIREAASRRGSRTRRIPQLPAPAPLHARIR